MKKTISANPSNLLQEFMQMQVNSSQHIFLKVFTLMMGQLSTHHTILFFRV